MDRLAEQVVDWHNRHPLAKRITLYDVHTIGVVALPFLRSGPPGLGARPPVEPTLTQEVSPASLAEAFHEGTTVAADPHPNAIELDLLADRETPPRPSPMELLRRLPQLFKRGPRTLWPVFSERFIDQISTRRIAAFAIQNGYSTKPGDETWPLREVPVDDALAASTDDQSGAWPCEIYVKSAAIDAGAWRGRVLIGRGGLRPPVLGSRCWDWRRVTLAVAIAAVLFGVPTWRIVGSGGAHGAASAASAASTAASGRVMSAEQAASAAALAASAPASEAASAALAASAAASEAMTAASAASTPTAASAATSAASEADNRPDIRPQIAPDLSGRGRKVTKESPPLGGGVPASAASAPTPFEARKTPFSVAPGEAGASAPARPIVVALVGPASKEKADAEKLLAAILAVLQPDPNRPIAGLEGLQSQVFLTPEGWRPAVYPFNSREQAQLVNAGLVAQGLKTRAINF
ncbi:hypothetical protein ACFJGW_09170 [Burkholderiaceae bacterium UC74_6]